jgi:hypothetical protein
LSMRCVSCKQSFVKSSFSTQFAKQCLWMGELSPWIFSDNIDRYVMIPAI